MNTVIDIHVVRNILSVFMRVSMTASLSKTEGKNVVDFSASGRPYRKSQMMVKIPQKQDSTVDLSRRERKLVPRFVVVSQRTSP